MGTTLDIKIKRANKVYHAGVEVGEWAGLQVLSSSSGLAHFGVFLGGCVGSGGNSQVHPPLGASPARCVSPCAAGCSAAGVRRFAAAVAGGVQRRLALGHPAWPGA